LIRLLRGWADDPQIHAVLIRGAGDRAICAGATSAPSAEAGRGIAATPSLTSRFFAEEIPADPAHSHRLAKPYIAIIDGYDRAAAWGVGQRRLPSGDRAHLLAMPETGIGLFPESAPPVPHLSPGHVGRYLALTGARSGRLTRSIAAFATHFAPSRKGAGADRGARSDNLAPPSEAVIAESWRGARRRRRAIPTSRRLPPAALRSTAALRPDTVEAVLDALARDGRLGRCRQRLGRAETRAGLLTNIADAALKMHAAPAIVGAGYDIEAALAHQADRSMS